MRPRHSLDPLHGLSDVVQSDDFEPPLELPNKPLETSGRLRTRRRRQTLEEHPEPEQENRGPGAELSDPSRNLFGIHYENPLSTRVAMTTIDLT